MSGRGTKTGKRISQWILKSTTFGDDTTTAAPSSNHTERKKNISDVDFYDSNNCVDGGRVHSNVMRRGLVIHALRDSIPAPVTHDEGHVSNCEDVPLSLEKEEDVVKHRDPIFEN